MSGVGEGRGGVGGEEGGEAAKEKQPSSKLEKTLSSKQIICPGA